MALSWLALTWGCSNAPRVISSIAPAQPVAEQAAVHAGSPWFADVTQELGIDFVHDAGPTGAYFMPQVMGSGAALFDFDGDDRLDLYLLQNGGPESKSTNRLYQQQADGRFRDVSASSGLDVAGYGMGVAVGDVNNDGLPDVLLTEFGRVRLFLNLGQGRFADATRDARLDNPQWGTSAAFFDYDRDGWLDLVVANYVEYSATHACSDYNDKPDFCSPSAFPGTASRLFHNRSGLSGGKLVRFEDVTVTAGFAAKPGPGLGVATGDFSGDRWPDVLVANDGKPNHLWINQRDGTFREEAVERGIALNRMGSAEANMGIALGDLNGDALMDVVVTHLTEETHTVWLQNPAGMFQDQTATVGVLSAGWRATGFGTILADFNCDSLVDLAIANGRVRRDKSAGSAAPAALEQLGPFWSHYGDRNQVFAGTAGGRLVDISAANESLSARYHVSRALACGDLDNNGALDLVVTNIAGPALVYRNTAPPSGHWLMIRAVDPALHRDAYGAEILLVAGERRFLRWLNPAHSYLASSDPRVHFGLGAVDTVDEIRITWPEGTQESFGPVGADNVLVLEKGAGRPAAVIQ